MVGRCISHWKGLFSGAMLVSGRVYGYSLVYISHSFREWLVAIRIKRRQMQWFEAVESKKSNKNYVWYMGVSKNMGKPPNHPFVHRVFHYKPSILGYPYFWKHPYLKNSKNVLLRSIFPNQFGKDHGKLPGRYHQIHLIFCFNRWIRTLRNARDWQRQLVAFSYTSHGAFAAPRSGQIRFWYPPAI